MKEREIEGKLLSLFHGAASLEGKVALVREDPRQVALEMGVDVERYD